MKILYISTDVFLTRGENIEKIKFPKRHVKEVSFHYNILSTLNK